jgi:hypothetical protein
LPPSVPQTRAEREWREACAGFPVMAGSSEEGLQEVRPAELLSRLYREGAVVRVSEGRLRIKLSPTVLSSDLRQAIVTHKQKLVELLALADEYRTRLRAVFRVRAAVDDGSDAVYENFADEQARLTDELGPVLAREVYLITGRAWRKETTICPWCDENGDCDEPGATG